MQLEDVGLITAEDLQRVIGLLKATFTHVVLDLSKGYTAIDLMALEMANTVLLVTQLDLPCLRNVVRLMTSFAEMNGLADKVKIVVNRVGLDSGQITLKKAEETIGREIFWQLPNEYRTMIEARNNGVPLIEQAPKSAVTQSIIGVGRPRSPATIKPKPAEAAGKKRARRTFLRPLAGEASEVTLQARLGVRVPRFACSFADSSHGAFGTSRGISVTPHLAAVGTIVTTVRHVIGLSRAGVSYLF